MSTTVTDNSNKSSPIINNPNSIPEVNTETKSESIKDIGELVSKMFEKNIRLESLVNIINKNIENISNLEKKIDKKKKYNII